MPNVDTILLAVVFAALVTGQAFGWGAGHNDQTTLLLKMLPDEIRNFIPPADQKKMIRTYSHYPDSFEKFDEAFIGPNAVALLKKRGVKTRYSLHHDRGIATSFILLTDAFREKNPERAALWMGSLGHAIGDECACNHDPLLHYMTYALSSYKIKMGKGPGMDFSQAARHASGAKAIDRLVAHFKPEPFSLEPAETLERLMMYTVEGCSFMTRRSARIAAGYRMNATPETIDDARLALTELGVDGAKAAARAVVTAWQYAQEGKKPELTKEISARFEKRKTAYLAERPLADDSIYDGLLETGAPERFVGAIIESSQTMNRVYMGFSGKFVMASIMREMKNARLAYRALDFRTIVSKGAPSPQAMPVAIICSGPFHPPAGFCENLRAYAKAGGKLLWIGGREKGALAPFSKSFVAVDNAQLPVTSKYGKLHTETIAKCRITFRGELAKALGPAPRAFRHNPNTAAGWQKPWCPFRIETGGRGITELVGLTVGDEKMTVGAVFAGADGKPRFVFVPEYVVAPFMLSEADTMEDPSRPVLDPVGRAVVTSSLKMLAPELVAK